MEGHAEKCVDMHCELACEDASALNLAERRLPQIIIKSTQRTPEHRRTRTNTRKMDLAGLWKPDLLGTVTKHLRNISHQMEHSFNNKKLARS